MIHTRPEAVAHLESAVRAWAEAAGQTSLHASSAVKRLVAAAETDVRRRRKRLAQVEAALAAAQPSARSALARELRQAEEHLRDSRRALTAARDADRRVQLLTVRINEATKQRVPRAANELNRKHTALADYSSGATPSTGHHSHAYVRLAGMIGLAVVDQVTDALAQSADQATAGMPDRIGDPLSAGGALYHEIRDGWEAYRLTPEFIAMYAHRMKPR